MGRVRHPNLQDSNGHYIEGATVETITDRATDTEANAYTTEEGPTEVTYPLTSGSEGEINAWLPTGAYESTFGDDSVDTPAVWEAVSGEDVSSMLTLEDIAAFPDYVFSPLTYGGDPTGDTDSTEALQAAIDAAIEVGGTVHLGNDAVWAFSETLVGGIGIRITGAQGGTGNTPTLRYEGTGSSPALNFGNMRRFEVDHFRFIYRDPTFTGNLLHLIGSTSDISRFWIHHMFFERHADAVGFPARCFIMLSRAIIGKISDCAFDGAQNLIVVGSQEQSGSNYVNNVQITGCTFNDTYENVDGDAGQIKIGANDLEALQIDNCSFEAGGAAALTAIRGTNGMDGDDKTNAIYSLNLINNWFGDTGDDTNWVTGLNGHVGDGPINFIGNFFGSNAGGYHIRSGQDGARFNCIGNHFAGGSGSVFGSTHGTGYNVGVFEGNHLDALSLWDVGDEPGQFTRISANRNRLVGSLELQHHTDFEDTVESTDFTDAMLIGGTVSIAGDLLALGARAGIYSRSITGASRCLALQAGTNDDDNEVQLVAGVTPAMKLRASNTGIAFNGTAPIAKPSLGAAASDPATTQTLANNLRTALINLGLAQT